MKVRDFFVLMIASIRDLNARIRRVIEFTGTRLAETHARIDELDERLGRRIDGETPQQPYPLQC